MNRKPAIAGIRDLNPGKKAFALFVVSVFTILIASAGCGTDHGGGADPRTTFTVTYDGNGNTGGNIPIDTKQYEAGQTVTVLGNSGDLVKTGYSFAGWNTQPDGSGTTYIEAQTFTIGPANVALFANWISAPSATRGMAIPDTGQTACYNDAGGEIACAGTGQDGEYAINPMSFRNKGDGTILDNVTGLTWERCTAGQSGPDCATGAAGTTVYNWYEATGTYDATYNPSTISVCGSLNLAGTGWRLPTDLELVTIADYQKFSPAVNTAYFPNTQPGAPYWASTASVSFTNQGWELFSDNGGVSYFDKSKLYYVRCVRGSPAAAGGSFTSNNNGTITDLTTNLMWQQCSAGLNGENCAAGTVQNFFWDEAIAYCEALSLGGFSDWRLPNVKELKSIADTTRYNPAINTVYFPNTLSSAYWSSTTYITDVIALYSAWLIDFGYGGTAAAVKNRGNYPNFPVRCVRGQ